MKNVPKYPLLPCLYDVPVDEKEPALIKHPADAFSSHYIYTPSHRSDSK